MRLAGTVAGLAVVAIAIWWFARSPGEHAAPPAASAPARPQPHRAPILPLDRGHRDDVLAKLRAIYDAPQPPRRPTVPMRGPYLHDRLQHDIMPIVRACFDAASARDPALGGKLVLAMKLVGNRELGAVVAAVEVDPTSTVHDAALIDCATQGLLAITFEGPADGGYMALDHAFDLIGQNQQP